MKKIQLSMLSAGMLALVLSGCNNDDPVIQRNRTGSTISFQPVTDKPQRGSALQKTASLTTSTLTQFYVWGYDENGIRYVTDLNPADVGRTSSNGIWTYTPRAEWPDVGTVSFYAVTTNGNDVSLGVSETGGVYKLNYTNPHSDVTSQKDLLVAVKAGVSVPAAGQNATVPLYFQHALSRVRVQVRNEDPNDTIKVKELKLLSLCRKGNLVLNAANIPDAPSYTYGSESPIWTDQETTADIQAALAVDGVLVPYISTGGPNGGYVSVVGDSAGVSNADNSIMVLPQITTLGTSTTTTPSDVTNAFYLYMKIDDVDGNGNVTGGQEHWIAVPKPSSIDQPIVFQPGREYTLQVKMNANRFIQFEGVQVNDWDKTAGTGVDGNIGVVPATQ